jgi:outer membrane protein TolC
MSPGFKEEAPESFKEADLPGWKQAQPGDAYDKGRWWEIYRDSALNALEQQVQVSNQNVAQAEAHYRQAKAEVRVARAALFPTVSGSAGVSESRSISGSGANSAANTFISGNSPSTRTIYQLPFDVAWEPDIWGNLRRSVTASAENAQAVAAGLENVRLLYQAELAQDYFQLHGVDAQVDLLNRTLASYQEFLTLTRNRFAVGVASDLDIAEAESQLYGVQSELIDLGVQRSQLEHAIAILIGKAPSELSLPPGDSHRAPTAGSNWDSFRVAGTTPRYRGGGAARGRRKRADRRRNGRVLSGPVLDRIRRAREYQLCEVV